MSLVYIRRCIECITKVDAVSESKAVDCVHV